MRDLGVERDSEGLRGREVWLAYVSANRSNTLARLTGCEQTSHQVNLVLLSRKGALRTHSNLRREAVEEERVMCSHQ